MGHNLHIDGHVIVLDVAQVVDLDDCQRQDANLTSSRHTESGGHKFEKTAVGEAKPEFFFYCLGAPSPPAEQSQPYACCCMASSEFCTLQRKETPPRPIRQDVHTRYHGDAAGTVQ